MFGIAALTVSFNTFTYSHILYSIYCNKFRHRLTNAEKKPSISHLHNTYKRNDDGKQIIFYLYLYQ